MSTLDLMLNDDFPIELMSDGDCEQLRSRIFKLLSQQMVSVQGRKTCLEAMNICIKSSGEMDVELPNGDQIEYQSNGITYLYKNSGSYRSPVGVRYLEDV